MSVVDKIKAGNAQAIADLYKEEITELDIQVNATKPEFTGDYTVVLFGLLNALKNHPRSWVTKLAVTLFRQNGALFSGYKHYKRLF